MNSHKRIWDLACAISRWNRTNDTFKSSPQEEIGVSAALIQQLWWEVRCNIDPAFSGREEPFSYEEAAVHNVMDS